MFRNKMVRTGEELDPLISRQLQVLDFSKYQMFDSDSWMCGFARAQMHYKREQQRVQIIHRLVRLAAQRQCVKYINGNHHSKIKE